MNETDLSDAVAVPSREVINILLIYTREVKQRMAEHFSTYWFFSGINKRSQIANSRRSTFHVNIKDEFQVFL